jgi:hypothetical protein
MVKKYIVRLAKKINQTQKGVNWQFSIEKARHKLKSIYPKIEC